MTPEEEAPATAGRVVHTAYVLLRRGGLVALVAMVVGSLPGTLAAVGVATSRLRNGPGLVLALVFFSLVTAHALNVGLHAGPFAAFQLARRGPPTIRATMGQAWRSSWGLLRALTVEAFTMLLVGFGGAGLVTAFTTSAPGARITGLLAGGFLALMGALLHGTMLVNAASVVAGVGGVNASPRLLLLPGAMPLLMGASVAGRFTFPAPAMGPALDPMVSLVALVALAVGAVLVSCALAVAIVHELTTPYGSLEP